MASDSRQGYCKKRRGLIEHLEQDRLGFLEYGVLSYIIETANYKSAILWSNAKLLSGALAPLSDRTIQELLEALKAKRYVWYPGKRSGLRKYPIFVHKGDREGNSRLQVWNREGELLGEAAEWDKKTPSVDAASSTPPKLTIRADGAIKRRPHRKGRRMVLSEKTAETENGAGAGAGGSEGSKVLSIAGLSESEGGNFRKVGRMRGRVPPAEAPRSENENENERHKGAPPRPQSSSPGVDPRATPEVIEVTFHFGASFSKTFPKLPAWSSGPDDGAAAYKLVTSHGAAEVTKAIDAAHADPYWRKGIHTFRSLKKNWSYVHALVTGEANARPGRGSRRPRGRAVPNEDDFHGDDELPASLR